MRSLAAQALTVALRDGTPARIRPVRADDRARVLRGVREMSRTSRYLRFFASAREMSDEQARYLVEVDQLDHVAVCAVEPTVEEGRGYGIARFVRDTDNPGIAEFAVAVIDELQGRGLGTILLAALYLRAQTMGISELRGDVLAENLVMARWLQRLGAALDATSIGGSRLIHWPIRAIDAPPPPCDAQDFIHWLKRLRSTFGPAAGAA